MEQQPIINDQFIKIIDAAIAARASDILLSANLAPTIRVDGALQVLAGSTPLSIENMEQIVKSLLSESQYQKYTAELEIDFSFSHPKVRFRGNAFFQKGQSSISLRLIPKEIKNFRQLDLPPILEKIALSSYGFVVVTGPTGHGKSTTIASIMEYINNNRFKHIITIEDPIEFEFQNKKSIVAQREVGTDTHSFSRALKSILREDPDIIMLGEMRDLESIQSALTLAETGHLVLTTLHTNSSSETIDRIIDVFPPTQQRQVRQQLASILLGVFSQRLIPRASQPGMALAVEVMVTNPAIRSLIREGKIHQIDNAISTGASEGMIGLDKVLAELVSRGDITLDAALGWARDRNNLKSMIY